MTEEEAKTKWWAMVHSRPHILISDSPDGEIREKSSTPQKIERVIL